jgi:hypothetical protein
VTYVYIVVCRKNGKEETCRKIDFSHAEEFKCYWEAKGYKCGAIKRIKQEKRRK